jgi:phytoene dehydrogenase-like protein
MSSAIVVGSGPNGLSCAATLATRGVAVTVIEAAEKIGGGARSSELTVPGLIHDDCSATHPMSPGSLAYASLGLERHGLEWASPEIDFAHPFDDGTAATMRRSLEDTAAGLGPAGPAWKRLFGPPAERFDALCEDIMGPLPHLPHHPLVLARFGLPSALPATVLARALPTEQARALFGGVAAHSYSDLRWPLSSGLGVALIAAGHRYGWVVARGGSQAIADAMAAVVRERGGRIEVGRRVRALDDLPTADIVVFDLAPGAVADLVGDRLPPRVTRAYRRYKHGPGAFKLDLAVEGGVPWSDPDTRRAGTVHVIGSFAELVAAERDVNRGRMPERPFVLVGQQYLADPSRSQGEVHPIWTYAHVPRGYPGDATDALLDQIERFAPGLRERIVDRHVRAVADVAAYNANYNGGDILTGANTPWQLIARPRLSPNPYSTGVPGIYICSAATPPGAGAHGMCGYNAAQSALRYLDA